MSTNLEESSHLVLGRDVRPVVSKQTEPGAGKQIPQVSHWTSMSWQLHQVT